MCSAPPFTPATPLQLAVAALFGASVMAISAFYIHKRSVDQALDRLLNLRRRHYISDDEEIEISGHNNENAADGNENVVIWRSESKALNSFDDNDDEDVYDEMVRDYRVSSSMPNVSVAKNEWCGETGGTAARSGMSTSLDKIDLIYSDLPPLRTERDGEEQYTSHSGTTMRVGSAGRLVTPRSAGDYTFGSTGESDDEETELATEEDHDLPYENV